MIEIPLENITPRFTQEVELDGTTFVFAFEWNDRAGTWGFNLLNVERVPLITGVALRVAQPLLNRFTGIAGPLGVLEAIDTSDAGLDPGYADLGQRVKLVYTPIAEIPAALRRS